jgi:hypothetical protein
VRKVVCLADIVAHVNKKGPRCAHLIAKHLQNLQAAWKIRLWSPLEYFFEEVTGDLQNLQVAETIESRCLTRKGPLILCCDTEKF